VDWANDDHEVAVVDAAGRAIERFTVPDTGQALEDLVRRLKGAGAPEVATERPDGAVVEALLQTRLHGGSDQPGPPEEPAHRPGAAASPGPLQPGHHHAAPDLSGPQGPGRPPRRGGQPARAHLKSAFPGALGLFYDLDSPISLAFVTRFDCQDRASWLSPSRLAAWLRSVGYCGCKDPAVLDNHLKAALQGATGDDGAAKAHTTCALLAVLTAIVDQIS
jgi:hypothetical protein